MNRGAVAVGFDRDELGSLLLDGAALLDLEVDPSQVGALLGYVEHLLRWNRTYNLTAVREPRAVVSHHLLDCLAVVPALRRKRASPGRHRILDVGSGAGLPGLVLAVMEPGSEVTCVDSVGKKAAFIAQAAAALRLANVRAVHARIEDIRQDNYDVITARAFASLSSLVRATERLLNEGGVWMAMKGRRPDQEVEELAGAVDVEIEPLSVPHLASERCLVWMQRTTSAGECTLASKPAWQLAKEKNR
ncbi:MAG TPA: 16S rRNA (guanine(527)-N(7))-methyltransferase RsmG [Caldimonas sp.]|nr:16S rRNA (guanine(527)-N(7))-methyltransferase RsmG [Caldimonas sp.]HEX2540718.1 16S rRNA (guanine(527)-N(7))-methyltransferase RsmG [Caldimonas sp.]